MQQGGLGPHDPGRVGEYTVLGVLGRGGQGTVYLGADGAGTKVAIKVMAVDRAGSAARFEREIEVARRVSGPYVARVLDSGMTDESRPYVVTEYVDGQSLRDRVRDGGPLPEAELLLVADEMAGALVAIHDVGIVHRDLKPANVLLGADGARILDFGIATHPEMREITAPEGIAVGTPAFMGPEQVQGRPAGPAADVFAWGLTVAYAATGRHPFGGDNVMAVMFEIIAAEPDLDGVPEPVRGIVEDALAKEPAGRPTARDLRLLLAEQHPSPAGLRPEREPPEQAYPRLSEAARTLLRRSAIISRDGAAGGRLDARIAALLLDSEAAQATATMTELAGHGLLERTVGGYTLRDDVWLFAWQRLQAEESGVQPLVQARLRLDLGDRGRVPPVPLISRDLWTADDRVGAQPYAAAIAAFLRHPGSEPPLTVGITGPWGSGKTSLMRMVGRILDPGGSIGLSAETRARLRRPARRPRISDVLARARDAGTPQPLTAEPVTPQRDWLPTVWFNPWMYQTGEQIWAGLAHEVITQVTQRLTPVDRERFWLELNLRRVDPEAVRARVYGVMFRRLLPLVAAFAAALLLAVGGLLLAPHGHALPAGLAGGLLGGGTLALAAGAAAQWFGFLRKPAGGLLGALLAKPDEPLVTEPGYRARTGFLHLVQSDLRAVLDLVATPDRPLVVFVDDLDRCVPGQVAQVIEAVNLFLAGEFPNCVFVIAMEPQMVAAHIETAYADLAARSPAGLGWRFLEKVVQLSLRVPTASPADTSAYLADLVGVPQRAPDRAAASGGGEAAADADDGVFDDIVARVRAAGPTLDTLSETIKSAERDVLGRRGGTGTHPDAVRAFNRIFADLYGAQVSYDALNGALSYLENPTVRTIKRYVNLFRFLTFVAFHRQLAQGDLAPSPERLAKLAALHIRWPSLVDGLLRTDTPTGETRLAVLERVSRDRDDTTTWPPLPPADLMPLAAFLGSGQEIAATARALLHTR